MATSLMDLEASLGVTMILMQSMLSGIQEALGIVPGMTLICPAH